MGDSGSPTTKDQASKPGLSGPRAQDFSPPLCCAPQQGTQAEEHRDRQSAHLHRACESTMDSHSPCQGSHAGWCDMDVHRNYNWISIWTRAQHECRDRPARTVCSLQAGLTSRGPLSLSPVPALPCAFRNPGQQWSQPGLQHTCHPLPPALQARRWLLDLEGVGSVTLLPPTAKA